MLKNRILFRPYFSTYASFLVSLNLAVFSFYFYAFHFFILNNSYFLRILHKIYDKNRLDKVTTKLAVKNTPRNDSKLTTNFIQLRGIISP